jgi:hypothetical protein
MIAWSWESPATALQPKPDATGRTVAQARDLLERFSYVGQCRGKPRDELFARLGRRDAARGARQQPNADLFLQAVAAR